MYTAYYLSLNVIPSLPPRLSFSFSFMLILSPPFILTAFVSLFHSPSYSHYSSPSFLSSHSLCFLLSCRHPRHSEAQSHCACFRTAEDRPLSDCLFNTVLLLCISLSSPSPQEGRRRDGGMIRRWREALNKDSGK